MATTRIKYVVDLRDITRGDAVQAGAKAATLGELLAAGFPVPRGIVLTTAAFDRIYSRHDLTADIALDAIEAVPLPDDLVTALLKEVGALGDGPLAVRSSAVAEDLPGASFAGQYETVLGVRGPDALLEAVRHCWASAFSERVRRYQQARSQQGIPRMAVLVQQLIEADAAGVAFSANPVTGRRDEVVVNAVRGLGERLVSGQATPDEWRVRDAEAVCERAVEHAIDTDQARAVADLARRVEAHFGAPQDIEWAMTAGEFFLLQARPITALPEEGIEPVPVPVEPPPGYWERDVSHWPVPASPLQRSLLYPAAREHTPRFLAEFGMLAERIDMCDIGGWHYVRVVPLGGKERRPPPLWVSRLMTQLYPPLRRRVSAAVEAYRADKAGQFIDRWYLEWMPALSQQIDELREVDLQALSDVDLARHFESVVALKDEGMRIHTLVIGAQMVGLYGLSATCRELLGWDDRRMFDMLTGLSHRSTEPARRLAELAAMAGAGPAVRELRRNITSDTLDQVASADPAFAAAFQEYQRVFGYRTLSRDPANPTLAEEPTLLLQLIANQLATGFDPTVTDRANQERRDAVVEEARRCLADRPAADRQRFDQALEQAQKAYPIREDNVFFTLFAPDGLLRYAALEIGRRMSSREQLDHPEDVFLLEYQELRDAFRSASDQRPLVRRRKGERAWVLEHPGPAWYGEPPGPPPSLDFLPFEAQYAMNALLWSMELILGVGKPDENVGGRIHGIPASPGRFTGTARIIMGEHEFGKLRAGDVLVCPITSPVWSVLFPSIGALVTDSGGILNHPAIIAREYRIPAVVATGNATGVLHDGQTVTVDGSAGIVEMRL